MNKITCPFCKNDKDFSIIKIDDKEVFATLCMKCGRVWINEIEEQSKVTQTVYNKETEKENDEAPQSDDKELNY